jgi:hypothetical protein
LFFPSLQNDNSPLQSLQQQTFCVQESWDAKLTVGNIKSIVEVLNMARWLQGTEVDKVRAVGMNQGIEPKTTTPRTCT